MIFYLGAIISEILCTSYELWHSYSNDYHAFSHLNNLSIDIPVPVRCEPLPPPDRDPEGRPLRGPPDRGAVHVQRGSQRLVGEAASSAQGREQSFERLREIVLVIKVITDQ